MGRKAAFCALVLGAATVLLTGPVAQAFIPKADRTMRAIARVNRSSGRSQALQLDLTMRVGDRDPIASGQMISHPSGLARLELRGVNGRLDRYLLSGRELLGAKNGEPIDQPQPLLQPYFFLQPSTETTLRAALQAFDVLSDSIGLATCGEQDCFVIGDPRLAAPLPDRERRLSSIDEADVLADPLELLADGEVSEGTIYDLAADAQDGLVGPDGRMHSNGLQALVDLEGPEMMIPEDAMLPRLWVDTDDLQVRRIDRASGVFTIFGPIVSFEKLMVPAWFEIHEPGAEAIRFEVDRAVQVNAPPKAFSRKWVYAPMTPTNPTPGAGMGSGNTPDAAAPGNRLSPAR